MGPLLLVDTPYLLFRGFFALPKKITDSQGRPVNGLLSTANTVLRAIDEHHPRAVVLCFGPDAAKYRKELYPPYHAHRPPVPPELQAQFDAAPTFFSEFGWYVEEHDELEADDLLGSLAEAEVEAGGSALILTGDRDLFQCVGDNVTVIYAAGGKGLQLIDRGEVKRRYGVEPEQVPDFIALRGDPSDGLPGAKGIGEKTAAEILRRHGTLEQALEVAEREGTEKLTRDADLLRAFREIASLRDADIERPGDRATDPAAAARAARALGMDRLAGRLEGR